MNKHIQLVEKWLNDKDSVTQEELEQNKKDADAAAFAADADDAYFAANYAANYAAYYATDDAADAEYWVKKYYKLTGEKMINATIPKPETRDDYQKEDNVNNPDHYTKGGIETIDYMKAKSNQEEFNGYLRLNCLKYLSRSGLKNDTIEDLKKAQWYLNRLINELGE
tara:strand:+ start:192 stop:692 length:501 start_codon:yes stop_codon:yes gene_type:complete